MESQEKFKGLAQRFAEALEWGELTEMSHNKLAPRFDITPVVIGRILRAQQGMSMDTAVKVAMEANVSVDWLFTGRGEMCPTIINRTILDISRLKKKDQESITTLVRSLDAKANRSTS